MTNDQAEMLKCGDKVRNGTFSGAVVGVRHEMYAMYTADRVCPARCDVDGSNYVIALDDNVSTVQTNHVGILAWELVESATRPF